MILKSAASERAPRGADRAALRRNSAHAAAAHELQLLVAELVIRSERSIAMADRHHPRDARRARELLLGRQSAQVRPLRHVRVHHALGARARNERQRDGYERPHARAEHHRRRARAASRRRVHLEILRLIVRGGRGGRPETPRESLSGRLSRRAILHRSLA